MDNNILRSWFGCQGDKTLRLNYPLGPNSVVVDAGGYEGAWAADIFALYGCSISIFEPVHAYAQAIQQRFLGNSKVQVFDLALMGANGVARINVDGVASSIIAQQGVPETIRTVDGSQSFDSLGLTHIDLLKINIEGGEYELLPNLIASGWIERITDIQVQFHDFVPDALARTARIRQMLARTHYVTWMFPMVWENWTRRTAATQG